MNNFYTNIFPITNVYKKASDKSELVTQMIYGDSFTVIKKNSKWLKIKIKEDAYKGFIKNRNYVFFIKPTHKINKLKATFYKFPNKRMRINELTFGSKIKTLEKKSTFFKFYNGWINQKDIKPISYKEKNYFDKIKLFKNIKYKWGGKSFNGIDCSALIQVILNFNNRYCPRDTKDQVNYFKKKIRLNSIKKNDVIFWKGHVAVALSKDNLIHAYGPMKKTLIMGINKTIKRIKKTANLKVIGIRRV